MITDIIRIAKAKQSFKIKDNFEFVEFEDVSLREFTPEIKPTSPIPDTVEMWAAVKIFYEGKLPDRYKTLNYIIGDWVEENEKELNKVLAEKLAEHFKEYYPESEPDLEGEDSSSIWIDQLDFMPRVDEKSKNIIIEIELILNTEPL